MTGTRYRVVVTTLDIIRKAIRRGRLDRYLTLTGLETASGVDRATIHMLENLNKYPDLDPKLDTVIKIVEDGFGLTLCAFICWAEGEDAVAVGLPEMPESLRRAAHRSQQPPTKQPTESTPATKKAGNSKRLPNRHR